MPLVQYPSKKVLGVVGIVDAVVDLIKKNIIAKTNATASIYTGQKIVQIENAFQFRPDDEIVLIDYGYNQSGHNHYNIFEYAKIKTVNNTNAVTLYDEVESDWLVSDSFFIQKTIGHSPLYEDYVYYGDRAVVPIDQIAITIEPQSLSNEWMYIQGGLNQEYKLQVTVYGKDAKMDEGKRILDMYVDNVYQLLNDNMHFDIDGITTPLLSDAITGDDTIVIEDTEENREAFDPANSDSYAGFELQDNRHRSCWLRIISMSYGGGFIYLKLSGTLGEDYLLSEFAVIRRIGRYIWDSRASGVTYGVIQKGSAILRAGQIDWYCKWVNDHLFPQTSKKVDNFTEIQPDDSSSSSSDDT